MKKTLIALAVAASAAVSGSAMAWTANGTGNSVDLGGTLTPVEKVTPWEVKTGAAVTNLDAQVQKGQTSVIVNVNQAIPVLGIRNADAAGFKGGKGINPQINYGSAVDIDSMSSGVADVVLNVTSDDQVIGTLSAKLTAAAQANNGVAGAWNNVMIYAQSAGDAFFGGVGKSSSAVWNSTDAYSWAVGVFPGIADTWSDGETTYDGVAARFGFGSTNHTYHGYYASAISSGQKITINLNEAVSGDSNITWKASLPVTVTYM